MFREPGRQGKNLDRPIGSCVGQAAAVGAAGIILDVIPYGMVTTALDSAKAKGIAIRFGSFVFAGLLAGIGAVVAVPHVGSYDAASTNNYLLPVIASVFLGTAVIERGRFNAIGTWIAIYFLDTGIQGLNLINSQVWTAPVFYGGVLPAARRAFPCEVTFTRRCQALPSMSARSGHS